MIPDRRQRFTDHDWWPFVARVVALCSFAIYLIVDSSPMSFGYPPASVEVTVAADDSALSHSAVPLRDRALQERLRRAQTQIARREFALAIAEIRQATTAESASQVVTNEVADVWQEYRDSRSVVGGLLRSLPADTLTLYLRQTEPLARSRFLKVERDSDLPALRHLLLQFPLTDASHDSLRFLVAWHLDRREFAAADALTRRLLQEPSLSPKKRAAAIRTFDFLFAYLAEQGGAQGSIGASHDTVSPLSAGSLPESSEGSTPELPLRAKLFPSLARPDWQINSGLDDETATLARHALHEHFEQSIPVLSQARPLVVDGVVVRRSLTQVSAHDVQSGRLLWSDQSESEAGQSASRLTMNLSLQELMAQKLARGLQIDSLQSRLSTDGQRVFTVESGAGMMPGGMSARRGLLPRVNYQSQAQNRIVARRIRTGELEWNLTADSILDAASYGERANDSDSDVSQRAARDDPNQDGDSSPGFENRTSYPDVYFCGLPTAVDRLVLGLVQVADTLRLYAADRKTGRISWSLNVAEVSRLSPADSDWRSLDCRVTLVDGVLVCPTGSGLLVGVDLGTRSVIWSRRYSRGDLPLDVTRLPFAPARPHRPWWQGWRDNHFLRVVGSVAETASGNSRFKNAESILIAAGPDADDVNAIDPRTGQQLWSHRVESPVDLIAASDRIVIVTRRFVSALDPQSGDVMWKVPCREPVGTGYTVNIVTNGGTGKVSKFHVFPVRGGSLVAVNCDDGTSIESVDRLESLSGCLISAGERVISLNSERLSVWPILSSMPGSRRTVETTVPSNADDTKLSAAIDLATFDRSCGLFAEAAARLRTEADSPQAKRELSKILLAWLRSGTISAQQISLVASEAEQLVGESSIADLIVIRHAAARAAATLGDPVASLNFYAKLQALNPSGEPRFLKPEPLRSVRHDRLIQGEVLDLLTNRDSSVTEQLTQMFADLAENASTSRDPFALQRFTRQWLQLPMVSRHALDDRSRIGLRYGQKQLALLALADTADGEVSFEASQRLVELYEFRSYDRDGAAVRRSLQRRGFEAEFTPNQKLAGSPWNKGQATVSEHSEQNLDTSFIPVPVECSPGSLFDRLNVAINPRSSRNDTILRFYGDGFSGSWQTVLSTSSSPLKSVGRMYRGWGIGHFLVLQLGAELFGISPFDGSGEPRVQRLWSVDMANGSRQEDHEYAPAVPGFSEEELTMLDAFGRPIAKVEPVRAGYLCYQTRGKLVCLDPSSGQRLWQRYELPRQAICTGDGQNIFMIQPGEDRVTVLRVVDGAQASQFRLSDAASFRGRILRASGGRVLVAQQSSAAAKHTDRLRVSKIASVSLRTETVEWAVDVDPESTVFAIGSEWIGILEITGQLQILDCVTGKRVSSLTVQRPEQIRAVHVSSDASGYTIALADSAESAFLRGRSAGGGARNPAVTGHLLAIDARTAALKWQRPVDRIQFLLDQPKNAPCIVLSYRRSRSSGTEAFESVLHVINRETGEDILKRHGTGSASAFTFEPHADQHRLSIRMARKSIRLTFEPRQTP
ncbi:MAG: outer membrane protein assembly factor BamB family protein [Planctomycetales bacterium]